jgi:hypothetical protein
MSIKAIDYKIILNRDGQTQQQRMPAWLDPSFVPVDARTKEDFFNYVKTIAKEINFYDLRPGDNALIVNGTWQDFFNLDEEELQSLAEKASLPPHIALWNSFAELYEKPKELMNKLAGRHLDFYYNEVLRLKKNDPQPDKAHVIFELKKNTDDTLVTTGTSLLAGKDNTKKDLHYKLLHDIVVNRSKVVQLKSLYVNPRNKNLIHYAPVANSGDGLGAALDKTSPKWSAFGNSGLPLAQIGFCLASDVLKMKEGDRTVRVKLTLNNLSANAKNTALTTNLFKVSITGEKGWIGPKTISPTIISADLKVFEANFSFNITKDEPAVNPYIPALHGGNYDTIHPVLQVLLNNEKTDFGYQDFLNVELVDSTIEVQVNGIKDLQLENDFGTLNAKKPFTPFGPAPEVNATFSAGYEEAFTKRLKQFSFDVEWKNIPAANLGSYFQGYDGANGNADFTSIAAFKDGFSWQEKSNSVTLFNVANTQANTTWAFTNPAFPVKIPVLNIPNISVKPYVTSGLSLQQKLTGKIAQTIPAFASIKPRSQVRSQVKAATFTDMILYKPFIQEMINSYKEVRKGTFNLRLKHGFLFKEYPKKYTEEILRSTKEGDTPKLPNEPFAPEIQSITLNYTATTVTTNFNGTTLNDYVDEEIEFFHFGAFGQMREHAYARSQNNFLNNNLVKLFPAYENEGEFYVGFNDLNAEDSVCVLFQVAEGSANPDKAKADLKWSVLCDNYWKDLTNEDFIFDTTNDLLTSGVIKFVIPRETTAGNTLMPGGLLWLKAAIIRNSDAVCSLLDVQSNAAIAAFDNQGNDPSHFGISLASGTINKLEKEAGGVKAVTQPYNSFGGRTLENDNGFYTRVSERLRHKERSVALWDYERLILQYFPNVYKVKCINHASDRSFYEPGHELMVVVPDLTNQNTINPFQPKVDKNTLDEIYTFLNEHSSSWVEHHVRNPFYEPVKISLTIKLKRGFEFNYYEKIIEKRIQEFLSPWITNTNSDIRFGGKITKSMIVKFLEDMEFVDFLADLSMFHSVNGGESFGSNLEVVEASNPATILVSSESHEIFNY